MKKCCVCGIRDQDYDRTGFEDENGYFCFNCKPKVAPLSSVNASSENTATDNHGAIKTTSSTTVSKNTVASLIKGFSIFVGVSFFIIALLLSVSIPSIEIFYNFVIFITYFGIGLVVSLFLYAAGEIVQLLHNIDYNTKKN